jgi:protein-S-isoprenylcysteine O-methyltransferase Ste14
MKLDQDSNTVSQVDVSRLKKTIFRRFAFVPLVLGLILFWPAGTFRYWQAWTYIALMSSLMLGAFAYLIKKDPELLERRMRAREKEPRQILITSLGTPVFLAIFLLPGFDRRYGWSSVPVIVVIAADILVLAGYGLFARVLRENSYASRIVEVEKDQRVITTGPYAVVRHPIYVGTMIMFVFTPLALGSYWAVFPAFMVVLVLIARIVSEEKILLKELPEYRDYMQKVRYRFIPGVW